jgi:mannose/fructose-specific phosphotransferase system component IIA
MDILVLTFCQNEFAFTTDIVGPSHCTAFNRAEQAKRQCSGLVFRELVNSVVAGGNFSFIILVVSW